MKQVLARITIALCLMFAILIAQGYFVMQAEIQSKNAAHSTQELLLSAKAEAIAQAKQATQSAKEATAIIAKVEGQLEDILAHSHSSDILSNDVRTILCDSLLFDETQPSVAALAKKMVKQSCGAVKLPSLTPPTTTTTTVPHVATKNHKAKKKHHKVSAS